MKIIFSKKCLEYYQLGHPESPERIRESYKFLKSKNYEFIKPKPCSDKDLLLVHTKEHIESVKKRSFFDLDTPNLPNIYEYAKLAAGSAILASNLAFKEKTFSLMRPPGHHASFKPEGFCYFNNIAIAIQKQLDKIKKAAILDIDVHHGNGTENIFLKNKKVLYVSLHQFPLYPGSGLKSKENCINFPLPPGTNEKTYLEKLKLALKKIKNFNPELLGISAGFDSYEKDNLSDFNLKITTYKKIGNLIKKLNIPTFAVLEGGYSKDIKFCIYEFLKGLES